MKEKIIAECGEGVDPRGLGSAYSHGDTDKPDPKSRGVKGKADTFSRST